MSSRAKTKQGAAAIMVVIIITMVTGIITLSFVRTMLLSGKSTNNYSFSDSAYNSAMAGVEDAKVALLKYQKCLNNNDDTSAECSRVVGAIQNGSDCDTVNNIIYGGNAQYANDQEIPINSGTAGSDNVYSTTDQAFTCVKITTKVSYKDNLTQASPSRIIPVRIADGDGGVDAIKTFKVFWFTDENKQTDVIDLNNNTKNYSKVRGDHDYNANLEGGRFGEEANQPPVFQVEFFQTDNAFKLDDFYSSSNDGTNRFSVMLNPVEKPASGAQATRISADQAMASASKGFNIPVDVQCDESSSYMCWAEFEVPKTVKGSTDKNDNTMFVRTSLPYGEPTTTFEVKFYDESGNELLLNGVQSKIDSTGRAADQFRRVEARVNMSNPDFPYPEYALVLNGSLNKNFWITQNCFQQDINNIGEAKQTLCPDYKTTTDEE